MVHGVSPDRRHYFPAFPYRAYAVRAQRGPARPVGLPAPAPRRARARAGGRDPAAAPRPAHGGALEAAGRRPATARGRPGAERGVEPRRLPGPRPGHCGECHTPRNLLRIRDERRALAGRSAPRRRRARCPACAAWSPATGTRTPPSSRSRSSSARPWATTSWPAAAWRDPDRAVAAAPAELRAIAEYLVSLP